MWALFNAHERTAKQWEELISSADSRLVLNKIIEPRGSALAILEIVWNPEK